MGILIQSIQALDAGLTNLIARWTAATTTVASKLAFREGTNNGTNETVLKGQDSLSADITVTLPARSGTVELASDRETMSDADKTFSTNKTLVALTATLTAARVLNLPAANAFPAGTALLFVDEVGGVTSTNTVTATRAGSDTINGGTTMLIDSTYAMAMFITDGSSKWTALVTATTSSGSWVPTFTGFSANPTGVTARYNTIGKLCQCYVYMTSGTSNATTFTMTLPFAAANTTVQTFFGAVGVDNNINQNSWVRTRMNSNILDVFRTVTTNTWTASGTKGVFFTITYEIA